jgi:hypothetical protein
MEKIVINITKRSIVFNFLNKNNRIYTIDDIKSHLNKFLDKNKKW